MIGESTFYDCKNLKAVIFSPGSAVEEMQFKAFCRSGLEQFAAPPSLRKISSMAFRECTALKEFQLNKGIRELGWFCLWRTQVTELKVPRAVKKSPE